MDFWQAMKEIDNGHTVRMCVNPERDYRLAKDGCTIVCKPIRPGETWCEPGEEWRSAIFFSRHIRGDWMVVD